MRGSGGRPPLPAAFHPADSYPPAASGRQGGRIRREPAPVDAKLSQEWMPPTGAEASACTRGGVPGLPCERASPAIAPGATSLARLGGHVVPLRLAAHLTPNRSIHAFKATDPLVLNTGPDSLSVLLVQGERVPVPRGPGSVHRHRGPRDCHSCLPGAQVQAFPGRAGRPAVLGSNTLLTCQY